MQWLTAFLALCLTFACASVPVAVGMQLPPIQKLTINGQDACTTFSIHREQAYWITSAHCIPEGDVDVRVAHAPTLIIALDRDADLVLLRSALTAQALAFGSAPVQGDETIVVGYPQGFAFPMPFYGHISHPRVVMGLPFFTRSRPVMVLHEGGGWGTSGAPVFVRNKVVGMVSGGATRPSIIVFAIAYKELKDFTEGYWDR